MASDPTLTPERPDVTRLLADCEHILSLRSPGRDPEIYEAWAHLAAVCCRYILLLEAECERLHSANEDWADLGEKNVESLRAEVERLALERDEAHAQRDRVGEIAAQYAVQLDAAHAEVERLHLETKQDEARTENTRLRIFLVEANERADRWRSEEAAEATAREQAEGERDEARAEVGRVRVLAANAVTEVERLRDALAEALETEENGEPLDPEWCERQRALLNGALAACRTGDNDGD